MKTRKCHMCKTKFEPIHRTSKVCSATCCVKYYTDCVMPKGKYASRVTAKMIGMRSMGEVRFTADNMEAKSIPYHYEPDTFEYEVEETRKYTPDFRYLRKTKTKKPQYFYIEYKGVFTTADRKKAMLMREQYPRMRLYFVFMAPNNKLRRGSKTTYSMWCNQHGFEWSDKLERKWFK